MRSRWRPVPVLVALVGGLLIAGQPAPAVADSRDTGNARVATSVWDPNVKRPDPKEVPGLGTVAPATSALPSTALPVTEKARANALAAGSKARAVKRDDVRKVAAAEPEGPYYCQEFISGSQGVGDDPTIGPYSNTSYVAELSCNFYLDYAYGVSYVVDRSDNYNGEVGYVGTAFEFYDWYYGASYGAFQVQGDLYDGGRAVEIVFELYLVAPTIWGGCGPLPGLRYLICDGVGTNVLHVAVGTGALGTGLAAPVIRYTALGDSYSSGTGASTYLGGSNPPDCRRSAQSYPYRIAGGSLPLGQRGERLRIDQPTNRTCHGARVLSLTQTQPGTEGPQYSGLSLYRTRLATITISGNDFEFRDRLRTCILSDCPNPLLDPAQLNDFRVLLTSIYREIRFGMRADGRLIVLGYPAILPNPDDSADQQPSLTRCPDVQLGTNPTERRAIYQAAVQLRDMVEAAVAATGDPSIIFVDTLNAFRGQRICSDTPMVNNVNVDLAESFHPNDRGYSELAVRATLAAGIGT